MLTPGQLEGHTFDALACAGPRAQVAFRKYQVMGKYYWHRLVGTAGAWFFWDVSFYGNKVHNPLPLPAVMRTLTMLLTAHACPLPCCLEDPGKAVGGARQYGRCCVY